MTHDAPSGTAPCSCGAWHDAPELPEIPVDVAQALAALRGEIRSGARTGTEPVWTSLRNEIVVALREAARLPDRLTTVARLRLMARNATDEAERAVSVVQVVGPLDGLEGTIRVAARLSEENRERVVDTLVAKWLGERAPAPTIPPADPDDESRAAISAVLVGTFERVLRFASAEERSALTTGLASVLKAERARAAPVETASARFAAAALTDLWEWMGARGYSVEFVGETGRDYSDAVRHFRKAR